MSILLIYPPFFMPDKPYISIPVLSSCLVSMGIKVRAMDLNLEFFHCFLSEQNLRKSMDWLESKIQILKETGTDDDARRQELAGYERIYSRCLEDFQDLIQVMDNTWKAAPGRRFQLLKKACILASVPFFPEMLTFNPGTGYLRYVSEFRKFSSADLIESTGRTSIYSSILRSLLEDALKDNPPMIAGISAAFPDQLPPAFFCARVIKETFPDIHVSMGGSMFSSHLRQIKQERMFLYVDSFVLDDGQIPLAKLYWQLCSSAPDFSRVPGLLCGPEQSSSEYEQANGPELKELPVPDYSLLPLDRYLLPGKDMALLFRLSKGCYWARCSFCKTSLPFIRDYEQPSAEFLFAQLKQVMEQTGVTTFQFTDDSASPAIVEELSEMIISQGIRIVWTANFRVSPELTLKRLMLFKEAGCASIYIGIESCSDRILRLMNKGTSLKMIKKTMANTAWSGMTAYAYMMVGFPGETEAEALDSFELVKGFIKDGSLRSCVYNIFEISPYSQIWLDPSKYEVTNIQCRKSDDLMSPVTDFDSPGMSRKKAEELCHRFRKELEGMKLQSSCAPQQ